MFSLGNPSSPEYPIGAAVLNVTPFYAALFAVALVPAVMRRAWLFLAVFLFFLLMDVSKDFHLFAINNKVMSLTTKFSRAFTSTA